MADEFAVLQRDGRKEFLELHAVRQSVVQLLLVRRHVAPGAAIDEADVLHAVRAFRGAGCVHRRVAAAHHRDVLPKLEVPVVLFEVHQEVQRVDRAPLLQRQGGILVGPNGEQDRVGLQVFDIFHAMVQNELCAHRPGKGHVLLYLVLWDTEGGDDVLDDAAGLFVLVIDRHVRPGPSQEKRRRKSRRARADNGDLLPIGRAGLQLPDDGVVALPRRDELVVAYLHRRLVVVPRAGGLAGVGADIPRDEGERVLFQDDAQGLRVPALAHELPIGRDVLMDGAPVRAGGGEAVHQRHLCLGFAPGQRLDGFDVMRVGPGGVRQSFQRRDVDALPCLRLIPTQFFRHLNEPFVATRLQDRRRHRDGPYPHANDLRDIEEIAAAGEGDAELPPEIPRQVSRHAEGQGIKRLAGHIHLRRGQLVPRHVHREGVGDLDAKLQSL